MLSVYRGASFSAIWLRIVGAWLATDFGASDGMVSTNGAGNLVFPHFGPLALLVSVAALTAAMGLNAYSGLLTVVMDVDAIVRIKATKLVRIIGIAVLPLIWLAICWR